MRTAFFDKTTGYFLHASKDGKDAVSVRHRSNGQIERQVKGQVSDKKFDLATGDLVPDERRAQKEQDRADRRAAAKDAYLELKAIRDDVGTPALIKTILSDVLILFRYINQELQ